MLKLDDTLAAAWKKGGFKGSGFKRVGNTIIVTDRRGAVLEGLELDRREEGRAGILFWRPKTGKFPHDAFLVDVVQSAREGNKLRVVGGITYQVHTDRLERFPPWVR